jgi:hypothetical protein
MIARPRCWVARAWSARAWVARAWIARAWIARAWIACSPVDWALVRWPSRVFQHLGSARRRNRPACPLRGGLRAPGRVPAAGRLIGRPGTVTEGRPGVARASGRGPGAGRPAVLDRLPGLCGRYVGRRVADGEHRVARLCVRARVATVIARVSCPAGVRGLTRAATAAARPGGSVPGRTRLTPVPGRELAGRIHRRRLAGLRRVPAHWSLAGRRAPPAIASLIASVAVRDLISAGAVAGHEHRGVLAA